MSVLHGAKEEVAWGRDESRRTCLPGRLNLCFKLYLQFKDVYLQTKDKLYFLFQISFIPASGYFFPNPKQLSSQ